MYTRTRRISGAAIIVALVFCSCSGLPRQEQTVNMEEYKSAFRNPMKGLREYFDPGQDRIRDEYPYPFGSMIKEYMQWNMMEESASDGVDKVIEYSNHRWAGVEDINMKIIPRPYIVWLEPWHGGKPKDPQFPDDMDGWHWPSDIPVESGPYKQIPGSVGAYVDPADSLTPIVGGYFDPCFPERVDAFVKKLAEAWDNDPRVAYVEMGIIGEWGEHHDPDITTFWPPHDEPVHLANRTWIPGIDKVLGEAFSKYFKNKKVMVRYAYDFPDYEFGIYWDSWSIDQEIERGYNQMISLGDRWKTQVIGGEITWNWGSLKLNGMRCFHDCIAPGPTRELVIEQIRNLHCNHLGGVTWTNFKDPKVMEDVQEIQKILGYRYVISKARYTSSVAVDSKLSISFDVQNTGSSPFYYSWPLQVSLLDPLTHAPVWSSILEDVDICKWLPGENYSTEIGCYTKPAPVNHIKSSLKVEGVSGGEYILAVSILDPAGMLPSVRFANKEYFEGGFTVLGYLGVGCKPAQTTIPEEEYFDIQSDTTLHYVINSI